MSCIENNKQPIGHYIGKVSELCDSKSIPIQDNPLRTDYINLCKLYGACRLLVGIKGSIIIVNGPIGCAFGQRLIFLTWGSAAHNMPYQRIISTALNKVDVINGSADKLRETVKYFKEKYAPPLIAILGTCATGIIDEDETAKKIANDLNDEDTSVIAVASGGFRSRSPGEGYLDTLSELTRLVKYDVLKKPKSINIIGGDFWHAQSDVYNPFLDIYELKRVLELCGVSVNCSLGSGTTVSELKNAASAELNVTKCSAFIGGYLEEFKNKFGVPSMKLEIPYGIGLTEGWYRSILKHFEIETENEHILESERKKVEKEYDKTRKITKGMRAAVTGGPGRVVGLTRLSLELGLVPQYVGIYWDSPHTHKHLAKLRSQLELYGINPEIIVEPSIYEEEDIIENSNIDIWIGAHNYMPLFWKKGIPFVDTTVYAPPHYGYAGAANLAAMIRKTLTNKLQKIYINGYRRHRC